MMTFLTSPSGRVCEVIFAPDPEGVPEHGFMAPHDPSLTDDVMLCWPDGTTQTLGAWRAVQDWTPKPWEQA